MAKISKRQQRLEKNKVYLVVDENLPKRSIEKNDRMTEASIKMFETIMGLTKQFPEETQQIAFKTCVEAHNAFIQDENASEITYQHFTDCFLQAYNKKLAEI